MPLAFSVITAASWTDLLNQLLEGFQLISKALIGLIEAFLGFFGIAVPGYIMQIATVIALLLIILKYGKFLGKFLLIILLLILGSTMVDLLL